jgi:hypothetical protein
MSACGAGGPPHATGVSASRGATPPRPRFARTVPPSEKGGQTLRSGGTDASERSERVKGGNPPRPSLKGGQQLFQYLASSWA